MPLRNKNSKNCKNMEQLKKYVICSKDEQISLITHDLDTLLHKF